MKNLILFLFVFISFTLNAQYETNIKVNPSIPDNVAKANQYIPISYNGKELLSNKKLKPGKRDKLSYYKPFLLSTLVDSIKSEVREEISDSLATAGGGDSFDMLVLHCSQATTNPPTVVDTVYNNAGFEFEFVHEDTGEFTFTIDGETIDIENWTVEIMPTIGTASAKDIQYAVHNGAGGVRIFCYTSAGTAQNGNVFILKLIKYQ
jgi:hypothetical protein